jgi:hypothetical protein
LKNDKTTVPKVVLTYTVCKRNEHDTDVFWLKVENKFKEAPKMKRDSEDRDIRS